MKKSLWQKLVPEIPEPLAIPSTPYGNAREVNREFWREEVAQLARLDEDAIAYLGEYFRDELARFPDPPEGAARQEIHGTWVDPADTGASLRLFGYPVVFDHGPSPPLAITPDEYESVVPPAGFTAQGSHDRATWVFLARNNDGSYDIIHHRYVRFVRVRKVLHVPGPPKPLDSDMETRAALCYTRGEPLPADVREALEADTARLLRKAAGR